MPLNFPSTATADLLAREQSDIYFLLLEITAPGMNTLRLVKNYEAIRHAGNLFTPYPFEATEAASSESREPRIRLTFSDQSLDVLRLARMSAGQRERAQVQLIRVAHSDPDVVLRDSARMFVDSISARGGNVSVVASLRQRRNARWPKDSFNVADFPFLSR